MKTKSQKVSPGKVSALKGLISIYPLRQVLVNFLKKNTFPVKSFPTFQIF